MAGRPKRIPDPELARDFLKWRLDAGLSIASAARRLNVVPSTLARSLKEKSFSFDLRAQTKRLIGEAEADSSAVAPVHKNVGGISERDLRLLQKFVNLIPETEAILKAVLDLRGQKGKP